ncbi:MAG TPA: hypothetical protein VMU42_05965, partial [Candidatus Sulfotelmatobacter sp.]|nr:hypothetical protein [Candidatus Sulfotelmatobacter sp.]
MMLSLRFAIAFEDLYSRAGLGKVDAAFLDFLGEADAALKAHLEGGRAAPAALAAKDEAELLLALGPHLEDFLGELFGIRAEALALAERHHALAPLYACKRMFVQKRALRQVKPAEAEAVDGPALEAELAALFGESFSELAFARRVAEWEGDEAANAESLKKAARYAAWAVLTPA